MATKTKVIKESSPKAAKTPSPVPAPKKNVVAEAEKAVVAPQVPAPPATSKSTKGASKAKPQSPAAVSEPEQKIVPTPDGGLAGNAAPKMKAAVEQTPLQTPAVVVHDQRWQEIRAILEKLKEDTLREIRKSVKNGTEAVAAIEPGGDIYDQASSERDRELGLLLGDREREKIHSIDEALLRIDEGDYGICEECDEDIPLGRLKAMPFTRHCVKCKSDLEKLLAQTKRVEEERAYREIPLGAEEDES